MCAIGYTRIGESKKKDIQVTISVTASLLTSGICKTPRAQAESAIKRSANRSPTFSLSAVTTSASLLSVSGRRGAGNPERGCRLANASFEVEDQLDIREEYVVAYENGIYE